MPEEIQLRDDGGYLFAPFSGFDLFLAEKYRPWTTREIASAYLIAAAFRRPRPRSRWRQLLDRIRRA